MKRHLDSISFWVLAAVIAAGYAAMEWLTPFEYDNFVFDSVYLRHSGGSKAFSWQAMLAYISEIRANDNMRLANVLAPLTTLMMPKWLFAALTGLCASAMMTIAALIASRGRRRTDVLALVWLLCTLMLPWRNNIFTGDYALNYIFAGAVAMGFTAAAIRLISEGHGIVLTLLLALLLGIWHEGFALPLACGLGAWMLLKRLRGPWQVWVVELVLVASTLAVFLCPGMLYRVDSQADASHLPLLKSLVYSSLTIAVWGIVALMVLTPHWRSYVKTLAADPAFLILAVAALAGTAMLLAIGISLRTSFAPQLFAIAAFSRMLWPLIQDLRTSIRIPAAALAVALCIAHGAAAIHWQSIYGRQFTDIAERIAAEPGQTVYADLITPDALPPYTLGFPSVHSYFEPFTYRAMAERYGRITPVVPKALDTDLSQAKSRPAGCAMEHQGALYAHDSLCYEPRIVYGTLTLADGSRHEGVMVFLLPFRDASGHPYVYVHPFGYNGANISKISLPNINS